ncbi:acetoin utilization AcuB family protein [Lederbergia lenta]|uniref:Acetoin utilization protein AcuB n=1 Tax=Lederbergia lenta TaxID=1467 RepID=A0A2X4W7I9_LEDLE|nr:acetoin utilization AcuB family protein [Lederbergia lenta]MCM3111082.1 acetoin utilization AcuB family protein [Lederbergia lenta]MEC2325530.1 acetoin utilization AcuB family protein [Lederbergia lenta]SQI54902.1 acetoin utilization protein AcuB [Lederbergia lenta]
MIVEQIMTKDVATLSPSDSIKLALQLMRDRKIRHIPLVNNEKEVIGLVTDRDIKVATPIVLAEDALKEIIDMPLSSIMTRNIITGHPLDFVEEITVLFYDHKIGCLPIVSGGKLVGIITSTDLLHTMVELTGANKPGSQIEIKVENRTGLLYEVAAVFRMHKINIHSVLVYPDPTNEHYKILVFRVATMNPLRVVEKLNDDGLNVLWPKLPGMHS